MFMGRCFQLNDTKALMSLKRSSMKRSVTKGHGTGLPSLLLPLRVCLLFVVHEHMM